MAEGFQSLDQVARQALGLERVKKVMAQFPIILVVTDQVFAPVGNVRRKLGQEVARSEDLEVAFRTASQVAAGR